MKISILAVMKKQLKLKYLNKPRDLRTARDWPFRIDLKVHFLLASARSEIKIFVDPEPIGFSPWISEQAYISFDGNLLNDFNQLTDNDLETSLGKIKSSNSLNEYMTKINFCYSENDELIQIHTNDSIASEILLRLVSKIICRKINLSDIFRVRDKFDMFVIDLTLW